MRGVGEKTPALVVVSPSLESNVSDTMSQIKLVARSDQGRLKAECLLRDVGCCVPSVFLDRSIDALSGGQTECVHIILFGLG